MPRDFRNIKAWQLADDLAVAVYRVSAAFPRREMYGLTAQVRRSASSVPTNIAEGCCRNSHADYLRFLDIARGSLSETRYHLHLGHRLEYLATEAYVALEAQAEESSKTLEGLIRAVRADVKPRPTS